MSQVKYRLEVFGEDKGNPIAVYEGDSPFMTFACGDLFIIPTLGKQGLPSDNQVIVEICHKLEPRDDVMTHTIHLHLVLASTAGDVLRAKGFRHS